MKRNCQFYIFVTIFLQIHEFVPPVEKAKQFFF